MSTGETRNVLRNIKCSSKSDRRDGSGHEETGFRQFLCRRFIGKLFTELQI